MKQINIQDYKDVEQKEKLIQLTNGFKENKKHFSKQLKKNLKEMNKIITNPGLNEIFQKNKLNIDWKTVRNLSRECGDIRHLIDELDYKLQLIFKIYLRGTPKKESE